MINFKPVRFSKVPWVLSLPLTLLGPSEALGQTSPQTPSVTTVPMLPVYLQPLAPYATIAPVVTATVATITAFFAVRTLQLNMLKLRFDAVQKINDWYSDLEEKRKNLINSPETTKIQTDFWYLSHSRLLFYEFTQWQRGLIPKSDFTGWLEHSKNRCEDTNDKISYIPIPDDPRSSISYKEGIIQSLQRAEFQPNIKFRQMIENKLGLGTFSTDASIPEDPKRLLCIRRVCNGVFIGFHEVPK